MRIVVALGGNALLRRDEPMTLAAQRANARIAAAAIAAIRPGNELLVTHGNGPQIGLLALQAAAHDAVPLDMLGAESEGMIGYMIEQELRNALPPNTELATLLTMVEVDPRSPAFALRAEIRRIRLLRQANTTTTTRPRASVPTVTKRSSPKPSSSTVIANSS